MRSRLREIDAAAFAGCGARLTVEYGSDAERFLQEQGLEYDYAWREARGWIYRRGGQGVTVLGSRRGRTQEYIPERLSGAAVTEVGAGAFQADPALWQVYFAGTLRTVGDWAFSYCPVLEEIVLNEGLSEIGADAFRECPQLALVEIPASVQHIGERAFEGCGALVLRVYPDSFAQHYAQERGWSVQIIAE